MEDLAGSRKDYAEAKRWSFTAADIISTSIRLGYGYWTWALDVGIGRGHWTWVLDVGIGRGYWTWVLDVGIGRGHWI